MRLACFAQESHASSSHLEKTDLKKKIRLSIARQITWVFHDFAEAIVGYVGHSSVGIDQCPFNLLHN